MSIPPAVAQAVAAATGREVAGGRRVGGGDINDAYRVELGDGGRAFVKTRAGASPGEYATEAAALRWLGEPGTVGVPDVLAVVDPEDPGAEGRRLLALEWIEEGRGRAADAGEALGRGLAALHAAGAPAFGSAPPGARGAGDRPRGDETWASLSPGSAAPLRLGPLLLPNGEGEDWPAFYAGCRVLPTLRLAAERGAVGEGGVRAVERVCARVGELAGPSEPPARLHGDLWRGNVMTDAGGRPWLIDPAAYGGHREVDLAMLRLFGDPGPRFLAAYEEVRPLAPGHEERVALYQLFPLLVHAALFGGAYGASAERAARRYL